MCGRKRPDGKSVPDFGAALRESLAPLGLPAAREAAIAEELTQHLQDRYEELVLRGTAPDEAERALLAEVTSGSLTAGLREVAAPAPSAPPAAGQDSPGWFRGLGGDAWYAARQLRLHPGFTAVAVLSLALGTGANTAIFQLVDAVRLRALPVPQAEELAVVRIPAPVRTGNASGRTPELTYRIWQRVQQEQEGFSALAAWGTEPLELSKSGESRMAEGLWVSGAFFDTLRVIPAVGRLISPADDRPGCAGGVVLSSAFWKREFGGAPSAVGRSITLDGRPVEVLGVSQAGFFGVEVGRSFDVALPICAEALFHPEEKFLESPQAWWLGAIGRLKPGWTVQRASAQLTSLSRRLFRETLPPGYDAVDSKDYLGFQLVAEPGATGVSSLRRAYEKPLWLLMGISALVLLIACANLANLMLARASSRQREMAVRLALGATRVRIVRQLLVESLLLAALGTLCGAAMAQLLTRGLVRFLSTDSARLFVDLRPDGRILLFTALIALATCLLFGLTPAREASRTSPREALQANARGVLGGAGRFGLRRALVVAQVALSLVLLFGALLFVGTFRNLVTLDTGFQRESVSVVRVDLSPYRLPAEKRTPARTELMARLRGLPGVVSAASVAVVPLSGALWNDVIWTETTTKAPGAGRQIANFNRVGAGYFRTLETPLLAGRDFTDRDDLNAPRVAIVTEMFVKKFLKEGSPIGKTLSHARSRGRPDAVYQIVGLVKDVKYRSMREEFTPLVFLPDGQDESTWPGLTAMVRSTLPPDEVTRSVKAMLADGWPAALMRSRPFEVMVRETLVRERLMATLSGFFGLLAAVLAMVGLYGVVSYMVTRRRNEIGVRMALGADRRSIVTMVLREAGTLLGIGLGAGTVLAVLGSLAARALLFGMTPGDPRAIALSVLSLAAVAMAASFFPARRAASVDPVQALRE